MFARDFLVASSRLDPDSSLHARYERALDSSLTALLVVARWVTCLLIFLLVWQRFPAALWGKGVWEVVSVIAGVGLAAGWVVHRQLLSATERYRDVGAGRT